MGDRVDDTKPDPLRDVSEDSIPSSPEQDGDGDAVPQEQAQVQKRKGGRKPVRQSPTHPPPKGALSAPLLKLIARHTDLCNVGGEKAAQPPGPGRLQRTSDRVHQAARDHYQAPRGEPTDATAEPSHCRRRMPHAEIQELLAGENIVGEGFAYTPPYLRECIGLICSKGIDVQAELRAKTGSPNLHPVRVPPVSAPAPQPIQRVSVGKGHQPRRYITHPPPKPDTTPQMNPQLPEGVLQPSPRSAPTPTASHFSSPATAPTRSPNFFPQGGASAISPSLGPIGQHLNSQPPLRPNVTPMQPPQRPSLSGSYVNGASNSVGSVPSASGPTSSGRNGGFSNPFQSHYDQLGKLSRFLFPLVLGIGLCSS